MRETQDLFKTISDYGNASVPMHMPGHKRNTALLGEDLPYAADITEIAGFDDLHCMEEGGVLHRIAMRAAMLYGAVRAFPLVSGSTGGILSAIRALTDFGDQILIARNVHKSVYHAVELCGLSHVSILPAIDPETGIYGSIRPCDVAEALEAHPDIRAVVITSPTYEGVLSDVGAIAELVHSRGARLIVDAAHGSHLSFCENLSTFPTEADVVITSLHKTLPALTQTALALVYAKDAAIGDRLQREITVFETSSPSYVLLASIDRCLALMERSAAVLFGAYRERLDRFYAAATSLRTLTVLTGDSPAFFGFDRGKLVILSETLSGTALAERLRAQYGIECEMAYTDYVLCMTSVCDTDESFGRLISALCEIDREEALRALPAGHLGARGGVTVSLPERRETILEAVRKPQTPLRVGEIARVYAWVYPPGIPLIVPGECATEALIRQIEALTASGLSVRIGR
jgi:arginine/lysine/ornithine decarboxylase